MARRFHFQSPEEPKVKAFAWTVALLLVSVGRSALASEPEKPMMKEYQATPKERLGALSPNTGIPVGQKVPDLPAVSLDGATVRLSSFYAKGPILLVFYRGGWCPYCNTEIHSLTAAYPAFQKRGVTPVALSVDKPEAEAKMKATYSIPFPVLSDTSAELIKAFHLVNHVDGAMAEKMKGFGVDLEAYSGQTHHVIAIPALFLVDRSGVVRWAHSDPEFTVRPTMEQVLAAIDSTLLAKR
jgi:peroxiredoxin